MRQGLHVIAATLDAQLDHVSVAVADLDRALAYWRGTVGAGLVVRERTEQFEAAQVRFAGGGKLELLAPPSGGDGGFVARFLERYGSAIHHVTLKVPDIRVAIDTVRAGGYDVVDVQTTSPWWREGFLRPSQVGGLIAQVAWASESDAQWASRLGAEPETAAATAPQLRGVTVVHPDLSIAGQLWTLLGAAVSTTSDSVVCRWPDSPLDLVVARGSPPGPQALRLSGVLPPPPDGLAIPPVAVA